MRYKKVFKWLLILILGIVLTVYGVVFVGHKLIFPDQVSTVPPLENGKFQMGVQFKKTKTLDDYINVLDVFITYSHELFHMLEQPKWNKVDKVQNASRSERRCNV